jgi:hypothetical protein
VQQIQLSIVSIRSYLSHTVVSCLSHFEVQLLILSSCFRREDRLRVAGQCAFAGRSAEDISARTHRARHSVLALQFSAADYW